MSGQYLEREQVLVLDFGSQYTQLIARRVREAKVYCEIVPYNTRWEEIRARQPKGIILSGGPASVTLSDSPHPDFRVFDYPAPLLGICYGMQLLAHRFGEQIQAAPRREYGRARLQNINSSLLFEGLPQQMEVWMSHGDQVQKPPPRFSVTATTDTTIAAIESTERRLYGLQFHPEVVHTPRGREILENFLFRICCCAPTWTADSFVTEAVDAIQEQIGDGRAICGLSGGIDSTVAALLVHRAIDKQLTCVFIDNGLLRKNEYEEVMSRCRSELHLQVMGVREQDRFLKGLCDVHDPELKRKIIGEEFIRVFEDTSSRLGETQFLVQGTLYPDVIESVSVRGPSAVIKSHHNVGGLPERMHLLLVEPLRNLFKDEVRQVARELGLSAAFVKRQPFPGPGLAVRILGRVTSDRLAILREADWIVQEEIQAAQLEQEIWQSFAILLPIRSVGVMGDQRTYENVIAVRAVTSLDGMTADWVPLPHAVLGRIANRIVNEVSGVNRVVYDISSKPPSTIEWE